MAFTTVPTITDIVATANFGNTYIRDNQLALKDPPSANYEANEAADYSTSSTTYGNVDTVGAGTDFTLTITTTGGDVMVGAVLTTNGTRGWFDVSIDGTRIANNTLGGLVQIATGQRQASFNRIITGLAAGSHTFILQWKISTVGTLTLYAGAATANFDNHPQFFVREIS